MRILRPVGLDGGLLGTLSGKADPGLVQNLTVAQTEVVGEGLRSSVPIPCGERA